MSNTISILKQVDDYVFGLFKSSDTSKLLYHNYKHTYDVVAACKIIGESEGLPESDLEALLLAAWFHDVGYLESYENHEKLSEQKAREFLIKLNYNPVKIEQVKACIEVTKVDVEPTTILEEIICDADLKGLSESSYIERTKLLREENKLLKNITLKNEEWMQKEIDFLSSHNYYTKYAQLNFNEIKSKNLIEKQGEVKKYHKKIEEQNQKNKFKEKELKLKIKKANSPERGVETMFRTALKNHMQLSAMADSKANIMLSINALILSIIISSLLSKFGKHPELILATIFMMAVLLVSIIFATLSTKPKITEGFFAADDVKCRKANLLFFGNFHNMDLEDYEWGMKEMMKDKEYLYSSLIRDLHSLGVVLAKKYTYLRWCYLVFMYGMIISVLAFGVSIYIAYQ